MTDRRSRVLVLGMNYRPEPTGIAPYTTAMARGLARRGHAVRAFTAHPHYPEWKVRDGYGQWFRDEAAEGVALRRLRHYVPSSPRGVKRLLSEISLGLRQATQRWGRPDVIVAVSPALFSSAIAVARARLFHRRIPIVVWVQDIYTLGLAETGQGGGAVQRVMRIVEGWLLRAADRVVLIHDRFATSVQREFDVRPQRTEVIRNWTHIGARPTGDRAAARARFGWGEHETVVLHAGNMGVKQGLGNVIEAARLADERGEAVRFVLLGDGGERERLEEDGKGIRSLQFIRPLDDTLFPQCLGAADALLVNELPGISEMAVPSKLTSYFSAGRPVLAATDPGGITAEEISAAGAGITVPADDPGALLDAALGLSSDAEHADALGASGRRYRETVLDEEHAIDAWSRLLTELTTR